MLQAPDVFDDLWIRPPKSKGNKSKTIQTGLHSTEMLLHRRRKSEKIPNKMGKLLVQ